MYDINDIQSSSDVDTALLFRADWYGEGVSCADRSCILNKKGVVFHAITMSNDAICKDSNRVSNEDHDHVPDCNTNLGL